MGRKKRKKKSLYAKSPRAGKSGVATSPQPHVQQAASKGAGHSTAENTPSGNGTAHQSLAQKRAAHALACVKALKAMEKAGDEQKLPYGNYISYVRALPAAILMNGLGQALAMEKAGASKDKGHDYLYQHMNAWLCNKNLDGVNESGWQTSPYAGISDVLEAIVSQDEAAYIRAQAEALDYLEWLKKFAMALLRQPEDAD